MHYRTLLIITSTPRDEIFIFGVDERAERVKNKNREEIDGDFMKTTSFKEVSLLIIYGTNLKKAVTIQ